jgi:hypothetical protein
VHPSEVFVLWWQDQRNVIKRREITGFERERAIFVVVSCFLFFSFSFVAFLGDRLELTVAQIGIRKLDRSLLHCRLFCGFLLFLHLVFHSKRKRVVGEIRTRLRGERFERGNDDSRLRYQPTVTCRT